MDAIWCVLLSNITRTTHAAEWRSTVDDDDAATASIHIRIAEPITRSIGTHSITHTHTEIVCCVLGDTQSKPSPCLSLTKTEKPKSIIIFQIQL